MKIKKGDFVTVTPGHSEFKFYLAGPRVGEVKEIFSEKFLLVVFNNNDLLFGQLGKPFFQVVPLENVTPFDGMFTKKGELPKI